VAAARGCDRSLEPYAERAEPPPALLDDRQVALDADRVRDPGDEVEAAEHGDPLERAADAGEPDERPEVGRLEPCRSTRALPHELVVPRPRVPSLVDDKGRFVRKDVRRGPRRRRNPARRT
jgi:hypothetical protein